MIVVYPLCVSSVIFAKRRLSCLVICSVFCFYLVQRLLHLEVAKRSKMSLVTFRLVMPLVKNDHLYSFQNAGSAAVIKPLFPSNSLRWFSVVHLSCSEEFLCVCAYRIKPQFLCG